VYGLDGLMVGGGIEGTRSSNGGGAERAEFVSGECAAELPSAACAYPSAHAAMKVTHAARKNFPGAVRSILLEYIAISLGRSDGILLRGQLQTQT
jgi:hypothetical protein